MLVQPPALTTIISVALLVIPGTPLVHKGTPQRTSQRPYRVEVIHDQIRKEESTRPRTGVGPELSPARGHLSAVKRCCCNNQLAGAYYWDFGEPFGLGGMWGPGYGLGGGYGAPVPWDYGGTFGGWNGWSYSREPLGIPSEHEGDEGWQYFEGEDAGHDGGKLVSPASIGQLGPSHETGPGADKTASPSTEATNHKAAGGTAAAPDSHGKQSPE